MEYLYGIISNFKVPSFQNEKILNTNPNSKIRNSISNTCEGSHTLKTKPIVNDLEEWMYFVLIVTDKNTSQNYECNAIFYTDQCTIIQFQISSGSTLLDHFQVKPKCELWIHMCNIGTYI